MVEKRDWQRNRRMWIRVLENSTGTPLAEWQERIDAAAPASEATLRAWLEAKGVTGYAQGLLVMERFGYPDFLEASADELIDRQYADRPQLRPICDAIVAVLPRLDGSAIQARKTYVSLVTPRRTFARVQPTTRSRVDLGLRIEDVGVGGRLVPSRIHPTMPLQIGLSAPAEVDEEVVAWLERAWRQNV